MLLLTPKKLFRSVDQITRHLIFRNVGIPDILLTNIPLCPYDLITGLFSLLFRPCLDELSRWRLIKCFICVFDQSSWKVKRKERPALYHIITSIHWNNNFGIKNCKLQYTTVIEGIDKKDINPFYTCTDHLHEANYKCFFIS